VRDGGGADGGAASSLLYNTGPTALIVKKILLAVSSAAFIRPPHSRPVLDTSVQLSYRLGIAPSRSISYRMLLFNSSMDGALGMELLGKLAGCRYAARPRSEKSLDQSSERREPPDHAMTKIVFFIDGRMGFSFSATWPESP
jgi:hypothetical protein